MHFDKIRLPDFLIADLYKSSLVDPDAFSKKPGILSENNLLPKEEPFLPKMKFFGENQKNVVIVINHPASVYLNEDELTFLTSILKACGLNIADIAIMNAAEQQVTFTTIKEQFNAVKIILFNVEPSAIKLPFMIPTFQVQNYDNVVILLAPALADLNKADRESRLLKTRFWNSLKQVFDL